MSSSTSTYDEMLVVSSTSTSVFPFARSMPSMSPLISRTMTWSGAWMLYHTHMLPLFCATTTSESGTHCT